MGRPGAVCWGLHPAKSASISSYSWQLVIKNPFVVIHQNTNSQPRCSAAYRRPVRQTQHQSDPVTRETSFFKCHFVAGKGVL